jgi:hypothetical protein
VRPATCHFRPCQSPEKRIDCLDALGLIEQRRVSAIRHDYAHQVGFRLDHAGSAAAWFVCACTTASSQFAASDQRPTYSFIRAKPSADIPGRRH